jgi:cobalt-zinc-cadmium efflux system membrane fusion protein
MNDDDDRQERPDPRWKRYGIQGAIAAALIAAGVAGGVAWSERRAAKAARPTNEAARKIEAPSPSASAPGGAMPGTPGSPPAATGGSDEPVEVTLTPEAVQRAGIKTAVVARQSPMSALSVPGTVTSNAYRDTKVNALVGGVMRQVNAELGTPVRRGEPLAVVFSAELADAQMKYLSMRAMLRADHQKRERTEKLADLGAASRQELEEIVAVHAAHETEVAAARQRLLLLGLSQDRVATLENATQVISELTVSSPADGVVVARLVNPGQVVMTGQELFVVTDLSTVWIIGDLYEKDFGRVRVGSEAVVRLPSSPDSPVRRGRVTYIDPRVDAATRTAKVRVEVSNQNEEMRLGMYVTVGFETRGGAPIIVVPRAAVQSIGERTVVYVAMPDAEGRFVERPVKVGPPMGDDVQVVDGVKPGERIVTEGSFLLRSEAARSRSGA